MSNISLAIDGYKVDHRSQYERGTQKVVSNATARGSRVPGVNYVIFFLLQYFVKEFLIKRWNADFFSRPLEEVVEKYKRRITNYLGPDAITYQHIADLHALGFLPIEIIALPEGSKVPLRIPYLQIWNTKDEFFWLTNYFETLLSNVTWGATTSATTAYAFRKMLDHWAMETVGNNSFVPWQGHDFSFRGMRGFEDAQSSGAAHLLSFTGSDTVPAIDFLEEYYNADCTKELIAGSVPATEHSVMSLSMEGNELGTFQRLITEVYPKGIVSIVSDTWDFWRVLGEYLPALKDTIMARDGKVVIRPDSSKKTPVEVICGDPEAPEGSPEFKGAIEVLWDIFGGTTSDKGYKMLDPHIGLIYGDSITLSYADEICKRLATKGFASTNVVLGIGSFTYTHVTRDTYGIAIKATYGIVNNEERNIFKKPKTDTGVKNSAKGSVAVYVDEAGNYTMKEEASWEEVRNCSYEPVFLNGKLLRDHSLSEIRKRMGTL